VAEVGGACLGYVPFERIDRPATMLIAGQQAVHLHHIGVDPAMRQRGIGRALLHAVEQAAAEPGVQQVALDRSAAGSGSTLPGSTEHSTSSALMGSPAQPTRLVPLFVWGQTPSQRERRATQRRARDPTGQT
jgi:GNAT superfamily N-acetyltransferase